MCSEYFKQVKLQLQLTFWSSVAFQKPQRWRRMTSLIWWREGDKEQTKINKRGEGYKVPVFHIRRASLRLKEDRYVGRDQSGPPTHIHKKNIRIPFTFRRLYSIGLHRKCINSKLSLRGQRFFFIGSQPEVIILGMFEMCKWASCHCVSKNMRHATKRWQ